MINKILWAIILVMVPVNLFFWSSFIPVTLRHHDYPQPYLDFRMYTNMEMTHE